MSEGLRAVDVEEALTELDSFSLVDSVANRWLARPPVQTIVAAARDHLQCLASQEQTPDIMISRNEDGEWPESVTSRIHLYDAQGREFSGVMILDYVEHALVALVGFHPQPTESPEVPT